MKNNFMIYLAGPISGLTEAECRGWREYATHRFAEHNIICLSPLRGSGLIFQENVSQDGRHDNPVTNVKQRALFARDKFDCMRSDAIFFNLIGATKVSIGTVMELAWSEIHGKPRIVCMEENNIHDNAMLKEACPIIQPDIDSGIDAMCELLLPDYP
jgi:nucleoside 2-deoxyribosyltransferase